MADGIVKLEIAAPVATITLNRPPVNAIDQSYVDGWSTALDALEGRRDIAVVHIRSAAKVFCAGADLALMRELVSTPQGCEQMIELIRRYQRVLDRIEALGAVTLVELGGAALGGGFELALACDLRVASQTAKLGLPEAGLGLIPGAGGTQRLTRICGEAVARRIILTAEVIDGQTAVGLGMVHFAQPAEQLQTWTHELVQRLGKLSPQALGACKRCIASAGSLTIDGSELEVQETRMLYGDADTQQRVHAFLNRAG
ncbi:MAG: enoyl-CoA hydratase/isomerase family protein [Gammaproteobacteria bacterium]|nr:enoyl-CoA hydratase/isomerase family protein [Gammaproteobacteria bacterium]